LEHHWNNDVSRTRNSPRTKAKAFDYSNIEEQNLRVVKSKPWNDFNESKVPLLSDHDVAKKRRVSNRVEPGNAFQKIPRKDHKLSNVFYQSELQAQLHQNKFVKPVKAPNTHQSLKNKTDPKKEIYAGRPIFGSAQGGNHVQNVNAGRNRIFYSSHVF
jgi:hypothetical protein